MPRWAEILIILAVMCACAVPIWLNYKREKFYREQRKRERAVEDTCADPYCSCSRKKVRT